MDFWTFLTTGTAPWWSGLLGTVIGGLITYVTTNHIANKQREADAIKADDERLHAAKDKWREETITLISELLVAKYRYEDITLKARRDLRELYSTVPDRGTAERREYGRTIDRLGDEVVTVLTEIQRIVAMLQVISAGDIAMAAVMLMSRMNEHTYELAEFDFQKSQFEVAGAAGALIKLASDELGHPFGPRSGFTA